ncbi:hypothetical protein CSA17_04860 [bacterium DOLJORAL78_65_58]|nr:MAG: hypothetical protein CSB20_04405 [bacterium DOLZORAL124_64_63]PIE75940.1 MAG: hypothetical protein CSA17_04860 [bacterium DOLJORAL78_65_58]
MLFLRKTSFLPSTLLCGALLCAALLVGCGGDDGDGGDPLYPDPPTTAAAYTNRGWARFESGDLEGAQSDFSHAIGLDANYGDAHAGLGWVRLSQATSPLDMQSAVAAFADAVGAGESGAHVLAGRAAANLGSGPNNLAAAVADAQAARAADPAFTFRHRTSFNLVDVRLIEAFALAGQGNLAGALTLADAIQASGITAGDAASWQVDGVVYDSYAGAVLAHLARLSAQHAG